MKHVAVVPVAGLDASTSEALRYAGTLTPRVVALHVADEPPSRLVDAWTEEVPLVLLDGPRGPEALVHAVEVLKATEHAERVTVVLPSAVNTDDMARVLGPGVVVCHAPATVMGL
jgi:hypothetical protein